MIMLMASTVHAVDVVNPEDIAPGTAGVCVTEMDGGEVVEIPVTVIGTIGPSTPEGEIVLVRLEDERFEATGIIAGMSGSPVYIGDRLLGALAYGWAFAKEPIGGVTPFHRMVALAEDGNPAAGGAGDGRPTLAEMMDASLENRLGELLTEWLLPDSTSELHRLPVAVTSSAAAAASGNGWLAESWRRLGWRAVPGGSTVEPAAGPISPGSMVAGVLVEGDAVLAAGGTVTEVRGDQIWAFGHPFLGGGGFRIPMARAHVLTVLPSQMSSFKFFSVGEPIGSFENDRSRGIWGRLGEVAPMVPVRVEVNGREYDFRAVRHPSLSPFLIGYLAQSSQAARGRLFGDQTITMSIELRFADREPVRYRDIFSSGEAPAQVTAVAAALIAYLQASAFEVPELEEVVIALDSEERLTGAELVDAVPERRVVRPGETVPVRLRFRPFRDREFTRVVEVRVPEGTPDGRLDLVVADGASWTVYDLGMRPFLSASFDDEIRLVNGLIPSTSVVLAFERRQMGVALEGGTVTMPPSVVVQLRSALGPNLTTTSYAVSAMVEEEMSMPVSGAERIELQVRNEERLQGPEVP
jgi:hypothetical protein